MTISTDLLKELNSVTQKLIEIGLSTDQNFPSSNRFQRFTEISWSQRKDISIALKNVDYPTIYNEFNKDKNYSIKLVDGALLQMMYRVNHQDKLIEHRLAFLPSPHLRDYQSDPETYEQDEVYGEIIKRRILPIPIRFDYDIEPEKYKKILHPTSHLTIGEYKNCRIPIKSALSPNLFLDFILRNFYVPHDKHLDVSETALFRRLEKSIVLDEEKIFHINIL